jgi:replicative DNA helicase
LGLHELAEQGVAEIIVGKQRNGATETAKLVFLGEYTRFKNPLPQSSLSAYTTG